jgi:hypothetical protein
MPIRVLPGYGKDTTINAIFEVHNTGNGRQNSGNFGQFWLLDFCVNFVFLTFVAAHSG